MKTVSSTALRNNPEYVYTQAKECPVIINRRGSLFTLSSYQTHMPVEKVQKMQRAMKALGLEVGDSLDMTQEQYEGCMEKIVRAVPIIIGGW